MASCILPKNEWTNSFLLLCYLFLFLFWKKLKTPNRHFEIIWLLVRQESFVYKICMKFVWDWSIVFQIDNIILKHNETISNKLMAIHFAHDCVEMVRCSSVFRMSSIFAETSVSRTKKTLRGNWKVMFTHIWLSQPVQLWETARGFFVQQHWTLLLQVILFEIDCTIFFAQFFFVSS